DPSANRGGIIQRESNNQMRFYTVWVKSGHRSASAQCALYPQKRTFERSRKQTLGPPDKPRPPEQRRIVSLSHGRAGVTKSIGSIYADYGARGRGVPIPP